MTRGRFLVTGGAGFLGSHLCRELLARGESVVAMDSLLTGALDNISDLFSSERFEFEAVVQELTVRRAGRLVYRDRFCWRGPWDEETAAWHFGGN